MPVGDDTSKREVSEQDRVTFKEIGRLAHNVGDLKRHGEPFRLQEKVLRRRVGALVAGMELEDRIEVEVAVESYIHLAATHPEESLLCPGHSFHSESRLFEARYSDSGLAADLTAVLA